MKLDINNVEQQLANAMFLKHGVVLNPTRFRYIDGVDVELNGFIFYLSIREEHYTKSWMRRNGQLRVVLEGSFGRSRYGTKNVSRWVKVTKNKPFNADVMADKMWELYMMAVACKEREDAKTAALHRAEALRDKLAELTGKSKYDSLFEVKHNKLVLRVPVEDIDKALRVLDASATA